MSNKQSNKQVQNVRVVVNNKMPCCDKPKPKRRKPQRKPQQEEQAPMDEFPPLYTPPARNGLMNMAPMANRNSVYIPPTIQISNTSQPVPAYFDKFYTNMTRTMEDIASMIRKEQQDVNDLVNNDMTQETPQPTMTPPRTKYNIQQDEGLASTSKYNIQQDEGLASTSKYNIQQDEGLASTSRTPVKQLTKVFEPEPAPELEEDVAKPYVPINQEEQIIATSPEHSVLIKRYKDLYEDWEKTRKYSTERKVAFDEIKLFAEELELNLNNPNGKPRSAEQLRTDIRKAIEMFK